MPNKNIPDYFLERYILNELPENKKNEIDEILQGNPEIKNRIETIKKSNADILEKYPAKIHSSRIIEIFNLDKKNKKNAQGAGKAKKNKFLMPYIAFAAAVIMAIIFIPGQFLNENKIEITRLKGMEAGLFVYSKKNNKETLLKNNSSARENDLLQLAYVSTEYLHGVILSIDSRGVVTLHYPDTQNSSTELVLHKKILLKKSYELDDAPDFERFFFIMSRTKINVDKVIIEAETFSKQSSHIVSKENIKLDNKFKQISFTIKKE